MIQLINIDLPSQEGRRLLPGRYIIGRNPESDLYLPNHTVSHRHAELEVIDSGTIFLRDLGSRNGTTVNDHFIDSRVMIRVNDVIGFGELRFRVIEGKKKGRRTDSLTLYGSGETLEKATIVPVSEAQELPPEGEIFTAVTFAALSRLARVPIDPDNFDDLVQEALDLLRSAISADRVAFLRKQDEAENVELAASSVTGIEGKSDFYVSRTIVHETLSNDAAVLIEDVTRDDRFAGTNSVADAGIRSVLAVPLITPEKKIGLVYADTRSVGNAFGKDHLRVMATFGDILASKLANCSFLIERQKKAVLEAELRVTQEKREELERAYRELQETQTRLIQSEKMASLSKLVAGIAHEMNTPLGALVGSLTNIETAAKKIGEIVSEQYSAEDDEQCKRVARASDVLGQNVTTVRDGAVRLAGIVKALRTFAHKDRAEIDAIDLHEGLDSVLALMATDLEGRVEIVRKYGSIPKVTCRAADINQVFLNILHNAVQAIDGQGMITLTTEADGEMATIAISDTGCGIPEAAREHLFDPGFTTRGVGVGTGLGLAICYNIITAHEGEISYQTEIGKGTTFIIRLPLKPA